MIVGERRPATIRDVAAAASVSRMSVTRYFSQPDLLRPQTRAQIRAAVEELGYSPNPAAASLNTRRSGLIAMILPVLTNGNFAVIAQGLSESLIGSGHHLLIAYDQYSLEQESQLVRALIARRADAIVLTGTAHDPETREMLTAADIPVVEVADLADDAIDMMVGFSNYEVGQIAARHLIELGHRTIAAIGVASPPDGDRAALRDHRGENRLQGFAAALEAAGLRSDLVERFGPPPMTYDGGAGAFARILDRAPEITAVFAVSDLAAFGIDIECRRRGIAIPADLSIVGFGDFDGAAQMVPPLTTIFVDFHEMGYRAGQLALATLAANRKRPPGARIDLGIRLIERQSTRQITALNTRINPIPNTEINVSMADQLRNVSAVDVPR